MEVSKWTLIGAAIIVLLVVLYFTGRKSVHHEILIDAPSEVVWNTLMDMDRYPEWNPVMELIEGEVKAGNKVKYRFTQDAENSSEIIARVAKIEEGNLLNQRGGLPLLLTFNHQYLIETEPGSTQTRLTIHEDYRGIGVNFWNPRAVQAAYTRLNSAMKDRAELVH